MIGFLGVDIGTSSSKGVLVGPDGQVLRQATVAHQVASPAPNQFEMDPAVWWSEFQQLAQDLTGDLAPGEETGTDLPTRFRVGAVGVSGMGPCLALTRQDGSPVRPAILYGVDSRATAQIGQLNARFGAAEIAQKTGSELTSQAVGPKLAWVRQNEPKAYGQAERWFMPASYLAFKLTGAYTLDYHSASQSNPLFDPVEMDWDRDRADQIGPGLEWPQLAWPGDLAGVTTRPLAGIPSGTPVITGTIDAWSEAISVNAQNPGDLMLMYGTTLFLVATAATPVRADGMWGVVGALPGTYALAGGMATSGSITSWLSNLTGASFTTLTQEAEAAGVGANGLLMLPYFAGERTPIQDPEARGVIVGLTLGTSRGDLYRAALEGIGFGVRHNVQVMGAAGAQIDRVVAVGGGTKGGLWTQIVSDITGLDQQVARYTVGASYGAAVLAAGLLGPVDAAAWNPPELTVRPRPQTKTDYNRLYGLYRELYPATAKLVHRLH